MYIYVPLNSSSIQLNCTKPSNFTTSSAINWLVRLPVDNSDFVSLTELRDPTFSQTLLGENLQLSIINNTALINGTKARCRTLTMGSARTVLETTLIVYGEPESNKLKYIHCHVNKLLLFSYALLWYNYDYAEPIPNISSSDLNEMSINISWTEVSVLNKSYTVMISGDHGSTLELTSDEPYFTFSIVKNAPPCEVYNFSVTATPVLSRMLPSLPDVTSLESLSLNYTLKSNVEAGSQLEVMFMVRPH